MICPKCNADMEKVSFQNIVVDRCTACHGIWFDCLEHEQLAKMQGSEVIDDGDPELGKQHNAIDRIKCPVCHIDMIRMVDPKQHHLWFESCTSCHGVYFDAGEFRDFKDHTLLDRLLDLFTEERK